MQKRPLLISYKMFFGLLGFSAIVTEIATLIERGRFAPANFFSYFTIQSNLIAVVTLILSALALTRDTESKPLAMLRGASTLYMIAVGIIFTLLLSGIENAEFTAVPWDNTVLHFILPIVVVLDWFIDLPKQRMTFKQALVWLVFPAVYVLYTLIRGAIVNWYPYPFFNPSSGYARVAILCVAFILGATGIVWLLTRFAIRNASQAAEPLRMN